LNQKDLVNFCQKNDIIFQAYSSLGTSDSNLNHKLLKNQTIESISQRYNSKNSAQILLKWAVQQNIGSFN
jgi:methylglyoxal/glyoxal reductase